MPDGDLLSLYHLAGDASAGVMNAPTVLLLHGLEGTHRSHYMADQADRFARLGWHVVALEFRSCDGRLTEAARLYHSGETQDLDFVAGHLADGGVEHLFVSGVSLSANVVVKWLGEPPGPQERARSIVLGASALSGPFDLEISGPALDRALRGLYSRRFLRTLIPKALAKQRQFPHRLDRQRIATCRSIEAFDTWATAPLHGYRDAWDYWRQCSCGQFLVGVKTPLLIVAARDDPFNPESAIPFEQIGNNPWITGLFPRHGGHVGFVQGRPWATSSWGEDRVREFFATLWTNR